MHVALRASLLLLAVLPCTAGAILEGEPFAGLELQYDSNLFRFSDRDEAIADNGDPQLEDRNRLLRLGAALQYSWGLQRVVVGGELRRNDYEHFDSLDHEAWKFGSSLFWRYGSRYDGEVALSFERQLQSFDNRDSTDISFQRSLLLRSENRYQLTARWQTNLDLLIERDRLSELSQQGSDLDEVSLTMGARYAVLPLTRAGLSLKLGRGDFPKRSANPGSTIATGFDERELNLVFERVPSGISSLFFRAGISQRRNQDVSGRDFTGFTGSFRYERKISDKLLMTTELFRRLDSTEEVGANFIVSDGALLDLRYNWSYRLSGFARYQFSDEDYSGSPATALGGEQRRDLSRLSQLGLEYQLLWWLQLSGSAIWEEQDSTRADRNFVDRRYNLGLEARYD